MDKLCTHKKCMGCAACASVCTHNAITMQTDKYGFKYPQIVITKCINCGLCSKICPILNTTNYNKPQKAIACFNKVSKERHQSSSGGFVTVAANFIIAQKGIVYGCAFIPPMQIQHIRCTTKNDILKLQGSKYVQSDLTNIYSYLKEDLKKGLKVLFIGTPCQIAGIKSLFSKYNNLYTIDIICHGVPSLKYLKDTLPTINEKIEEIKFRNNTSYNFSIISSNGISLFERPLSNDMYMKAFFNGITFRPSCFSCNYAKKERISDITAGDFWKLKSTIITDKDQGVSLVLINTQKGQVIFDNCKNKMFVEERPQEEAFKGNEQLNHPFSKSFRYSIFRNLYPLLGFNKALWCSLPDKIIFMKLLHLLKK